MLRWIGTFEFAIIAGLCVFLLGPFTVGLALRVLRGVGGTRGLSNRGKGGSGKWPFRW